MISADLIGAYIKNPLEKNEISVKDLNELVAKYPYCSSLFMLQIKTMSTQNDVDFDKALKIAAAHVMDRERLFRLINEATEISEVHEEEEVTENILADTDIVEEVTEDVTATIERSTIDEVVAEKVVDETIVTLDTAETLTEETSSQEEKEEESTEAIAFETEGIEEVSKLDKEAETVMSEPLDSTEIDLTLTEDTAEEEVEEEVTSTASISEDRMETKVAISTREMSFIEWLKFKQSGDHSTDELKAESTISEEKELIEEESDTTESQPIKKGMSKNEIDALLDKFISEEPKISKPKKEFFNPTTSAKKSLEDSSELVSETLAQIHFLQKNYDKAIKTYKQLILIYPEKKAFFADQIKIIEKEKSAR